MGSKERVWLEKFFHDLLFVEGGAYTLWGSKPITEIAIYHYSDEEMNASLAGLSEDESGYVDDNYDFPENWEKWEGLSSKFSLKRHLLFHSHYSSDKKISYVYFVDVLKTALILQDNYELFRKEVGFDFHPVDAVLQMPENNSKFWEKVRSADSRSLLWGLLFGYGKFNAAVYSWKFQECPESCRKFLQNLPFQFSNPDPEGRVKISINNFELPSFISFCMHDEVIAKYEFERKQIKAICKSSNFLDSALKELSSVSSNTEKN